jgi:basic amino acid/polyamine antiporter, APA family
LTGQVAKEVGGIAWLPFLVAFGVALMTAFSYLELVTKYPRAAGAALYTHKAFGIHFITFAVPFRGYVFRYHLSLDGFPSLRRKSLDKLRS